MYTSEVKLLHKLPGPFTFDVEHFDWDILNNQIKIQKDKIISLL